MTDAATWAAGAAAPEVVPDQPSSASSAGAAQRQIGAMFPKGGVTLYYPYLRGKRFEALALRTEASALAQAANVLPIIEPVKNEWRNLERALDAGLNLAVITNPRVGDYSPPRAGARRAQAAMPPTSSGVYAHVNAIPTMLIDDATTAPAVRRFGRAHVGRRGFVVVGAPTANPDPLQEALGLNPHFVGIRRRVIPVFAAHAMNVAMIDNFVRQDNSSLYPADEFFTDRHITIRTDADYMHFGDYSIQGDHCRDGGGRRASEEPQNEQS